MHYWQLHIGDWSKSCGHLSPSETGFYVRLLNVYYDTESPIPADLSSACRLAGARTPREREEISCLLSEFFTLLEDGWHNKRADSEINRLQLIGEKRSNAAAKRWHTTSNANALQVHTTSNALQDSKTPRLQEESLSPPDLSPAKADNVPTQAVADAYNAICGDLFPQVLKITDKRRKAIRARWLADIKNPDERKRTNSLDYWQRYFGHCRNGVEFFNKAASGEHKGEHAGWRPNFDFLMTESTWLGVKEGKYQ